MNFKGFLKNTFILSFTFLCMFKNITLNAKAQTNSFDFSKINSSDTMFLPANQLMELIINDKISQQESNYLITQEDGLKYEGKIPNSYISTFLHDDSLIVQAVPYSYIDNQNRKVTWIPYESTLNSQTYLLEYNIQTNKYECVFENVLESDEVINVVYKSDFILNKTDVNIFINQSYNLAEYYVNNDIINTENQKYELAKQQYVIDLDLYHQYLIDYENYQQDLTKYHQYLFDKKNYDAAKKNYDQYLIDYENYQLNLSKYHQYLNEKEKYESAVIAYQNYLNEKANYDSLYATYLENYKTYESYMEKVRYQLSAMELIVTSMTSLDRSIYNAVMGDSVTTVLERKEELEQLNADPAVIDDAEKATIALKEIFQDYFSLQSEKEKYTYYKANYKTIKTNLEKLLRSLEKLYRSGWVDSALKQLGKSEKYLILIAQLAVVCNAIDDKPVYNYEGNLNPSNKNAAIFNDSWTIENKTILEILENDLHFVDIDGFSYPIVIGYPEKPIEPIAPEEVPLPVAPEEVAKPLEPIEVLNPGNPPEEVEEPICPEEVKEPVEPTPFIVPQEILELIHIYEQQNLLKREEYNEDVTITLSSSIDKKFRNSSVVSIDFYDEEGQFISRYETELGSYIVYEDTLPTKSADEIYSHYEFSHWEYEDGEKLDLSNVLKEGKVFPVFKGITLQQYKITWIVDGKETIEYYVYGTTPEFSGNLEKKFEGNYFFQFQSWDQEVDVVTSDATYEAIFTKKFLIEQDGINAEISNSNDTIVINCMNFESLDFLNMKYFLEEVIEENNTYSVKIIHKNLELVFSSSTILQLKKGIHTILDVYLEDKGFGEYFYSLNLQDEKGEKANSYQVSAFINGQFDISHSSLYSYNAQNEEVLERYTFQNNQLICTLETQKLYHIYPLYNVILSSNENVEITLQSEQYRYNELVTFDTKLLKNGIQLDELTILGYSGEIIKCMNNSFYMPAMDVYIIVSCTTVKYTVKFISDGEVIFTKTYEYGDEIEFPADPKKASDGDYSYHFVSWDKKDTLVTKDLEFTAIFEKTEIPQNEKPKRISIIKTIKIIGITLIVLGAIGVILYILKRKNILFKK